MFAELLKRTEGLRNKAEVGDYRNKLVFENKPDSKFAVQCDFCKKWAETEKALIEHRNLHVSLILPYLYLGNQENAHEKDMLQALGIKRILNVADDAECKWQNDFKYLHLKLDDVENQSIRPFFQQAFGFIDEARNLQEPVLVHCVQGISRSASFIIAYVMQKEKWTLKKTMDHAKAARSIVNPNRGFQAQLCEYEKELYNCQESTIKLAPWKSSITSYDPTDIFLIRTQIESTSSSSSDSSSSSSDSSSSTFASSAASSTSSSDITSVSSIVS